MKMSDRRADAIKSKKLWSLFASGIMVLSTLLASPVGAVGLWTQGSDALETDTVPNAYSDDLIREFMRLEDLDQTDKLDGAWYAPRAIDPRRPRRGQGCTARGKGPQIRAGPWGVPSEGPPHRRQSPGGCPFPR